MVSTHSRPKAAASIEKGRLFRRPVSTHSRPKAAERGQNLKPPKNGFQHTAARRRLPDRLHRLRYSHSFNTQPPEGGWKCLKGLLIRGWVSTHSRPKAAVLVLNPQTGATDVSTHSRPKAAGIPNHKSRGGRPVSTHSRPKAAVVNHMINLLILCFNTQPPEGGCRWQGGGKQVVHVSTHSRPKAAGDKIILDPTLQAVSTHSRPKAAAACNIFCMSSLNVSTHSRPKAAAVGWIKACPAVQFQHTAARRRLLI